MKEFNDRDDFRYELEALKHFNQHETKHKHLIQLLAAYSHRSQHFLIFPLAEGNLDEFWQRAGTSNRDPKWLLEQCHGLTQGLTKIHQYGAPVEATNSPRGVKMLMGRHGDIKPQNILWFKDSSASVAMDRLVLSDFTLMRFHDEGSNTETTVGRLGGTLTYRAPEVTVTRYAKYASQKYDVWSLGCVFLEFISCHLLSYDATCGEHFAGHDGQDYQSFVTARLMEDYAQFGHREAKYFLYRPGMKEAKVKKSVRQVSKE